MSNQLIVIGTPVIIDRRIEHTDLRVHSLTLTSFAGRIYKGTMVLMKISVGGGDKNMEWEARYQPPTPWIITGPGALMQTGQRAVDKDHYPFSMDQQVNDGVREILADWLEEHKGKGNGNGDGKTVIPSPTPVSISSPTPSMVSATSPSGDGSGLRVPLNRVIVFQPSVVDPRFSGQPRKWFDPIKLQKFARGLKAFGQRKPAQVRLIPERPGFYELVDGERRWRALQLAGASEIWIVLERVKDKKEQHLSSLIHNFNAEQHTRLEISNALQEQREAGETIRDLADAIGKPVSMVTRLLALQGLHPELKPLLDPPTVSKERIPIVHGGALSHMVMDQQVRIWNEAKKQPTKALILSEIHRLGKNHLLKVPRMHERANPSKIIQRLTRNVNHATHKLAELEHFEHRDLVAFVTTTGVAETRAVMKQMAEMKTMIDQIRGRLSRAMREQKQITSVSPSAVEHS